MPGSIRVVYQPSTHQSDDRLAVLGAVVDLSRFGQTPSTLSLEQEHQAELVFHSAFLAHARKVSQPEFAPFASLKGQLKFEGGEPRFTIAPSTVLEYTGEKAERPRHLELQYGGRFSNSAADTTKRLDLPQVPEDARFFELGVELKVDGAVEAAVDVNDRLDVPLENLTFFDVEVVDDADVPMAGRRFQLELTDGSTRDVESDANGVVLVDPIFGASAVLRIIEEEVPGEDEVPEAEGGEPGSATDGSASEDGASDGGASA